MTERMQTRYVSAADTAKIIRTQLKREFPGVKFSVRSKTYSGGASINVHWTDGPTVKEVEPIAKEYEGGGFDGTIDLAYSISHWLRPDGRVVVHRSEGTEGSRGVIPAYRGPDRPLTTDAELVHFAAKYVFCSREYSDEFRAQLQTLIGAHSHETISPSKRTALFFKDEWIEGYGDELIWKMGAKISKWAN